MHSYFKIRTNFLDEYFLNELVPWTGSFLNYQFYGQVPNFFLGHINNLDGSRAKTL